MDGQDTNTTKQICKCLNGLSEPLGHMCVGVCGCGRVCVGVGV